jgi:predicted nucleic acid-binding protein
MAMTEAAVIDATNLLLMLRPGTPIPPAADGSILLNPRERIEYLIQKLDNAGTKIVIPTPALSEALVRIGSVASQKLIEEIQKLSVFRIEPFDLRAAIEVAAMTREAIDKGDKKGGLAATYAKVKYDRQIVAIAVVNRATAIYSDDNDIKTIAATRKIKTIQLFELPLPPQDAQIQMPFPQAVADPDEPTEGS